MDRFSYTKLKIGSITTEEILFVSDIEKFTKDVKIDLLNRISSEKKQLVVFIGDILSGIDDSLFPIIAYNHHIDAMRFFVGPAKLKEKKLSDYEEHMQSLKMIGSLLSDYLYEYYGEIHNEFIDFLDSCKLKNVFCLYYSGNHDSIFNFSLMTDADNVDFLKKIYNHKQIKFPIDFEWIKLGKKLFITGVNTYTSNVENCKLVVNAHLMTEENQVEKPEQTIFVSHIPGIEKFSNLGSQDITNLKKQFKFLYHYHGHCKDYYGEYLEEGTPTRSVHYK
jgi:Icc-related predicted phosphoesterase